MVVSDASHDKNSDGTDACRSDRLGGQDDDFLDVQKGGDKIGRLTLASTLRFTLKRMCAIGQVTVKLEQLN